MTLSLKTIALLTPLFTTLFWTLILYSRNSSLKNPGFYMALLMLCFFLLFLSIVPFYTDKLSLYMAMEPIFFLCLCMIFPLVFFYIRSITCRIAIRKKDFPHFLPALILALAALMFHLLIPLSEFNEYAAGTLSFRKLVFPQSLIYVLNLTSKAVIILQIIYYFLRCQRMISLHRIKVKDYFSGIRLRQFSWIRFFYLAYPGASLLGLFLILRGNNSLDNSVDFEIIITFFGLSSVFFVIAFIANHQRYIENGAFYLEDCGEVPGNTSSGMLNEEQSRQLSSRLEFYFKEEKPWLNPDLKITDVAAALKSNRSYISEVIRQSYRSNFSKYVNSYRVEEAIRLFGDRHYLNYASKSIAELAGFNNYNSFVQAFRTNKGLTPGAYRKNNNPI